MPSFPGFLSRALALLVIVLVAWPPAARAVRVAETRPRILVRADGATVGLGPTVSELRYRRSHPEIGTYARLPASDATWEGILTPALQTLLGGETATLAQVRGWLLDQTSAPRRSTARQGPGHMAVAFDWIHDQLTPEERRQVAENIRTGTDAAIAFLQLGRPDIVHNFTYMALFSVTSAGLALYDEPGYESTAAAYLDLAHDWLEGPGGVFETGAALGGAFPEGNQYSFTECARLLVLTLHGLRSATDLDPFATIRSQHGDFLRGTARYYMAMARPDLTLERLGDMNQYKPLLRDQHRFVIEALASGLRTDGGDGREPAMLEHFSDLVHDAYGWRDTHRNFGWGMVLFCDPDAPRDRAAYEAQPLLQTFGRGTLDLVVMRHGWNESGVMLTFLAGDHFVDHQHFDKGAFTIYHRGALAIDSGAYDRMYGAHHSQYATRTVAHNAPLVFDPEQPVPADYKRDGGQRVLRGFQHHARWSEFLAHREMEHLDAADLARCEDGWARRVEPVAAGTEGESTPAPFARYAIAQAELAGAYGPAVRRLTRTLAYFPGAQVVIVDDDFELATPLDVAFQLHTQSPLLAAGAATAEPGDTRLGEVASWVTTCQDSLDLGEREIVYDGRLFVRTVTPREHTARRIGGKGFQWYVNGANYRPAGNGGAPRESGAWRIEVHPRAPSVQHHMVHALLVADPSVFKSPEAAELQLPAGWRGTHVAAAPEVTLVLAASERGPLPLRYKVTTALPCVHLVVGLDREATFEVRIGNAVGRWRSSAEGILAIDDPEIGPHDVTISVPGVQ